jgi:transposase
LDAAKKTLSAREHNPPARHAVRERIVTGAAEDIIVIDECGSNLTLTPRSARAPRGERAGGDVPPTTPPTTTVIASRTLHGIGPAFLLPGATDRLALEAYVEQVGAPVLRPGHRIVLDTLRAHHSAHVYQQIAAKQCDLWFVPSYAPDVSPIEPACAKRKHAWRKADARTLDDLYPVSADTLPTITPHDARGFFLDCGYRFADAL